MSQVQVSSVSRRRLLRSGLALTSAFTLLPLLAACGSAPPAAPSSTTVPTAQTSSAAPAASTAVAPKPTEAAVSPVPAQAPSGKSYKITVAHDWVTGSRKDFVTFSFQEFQKQYPNVTVEGIPIVSVSGSSSQGGIAEKVQAQFIAGQAEDVIFGWPEIVPLWHDYLSDLTPLWTQKKGDALGIVDYPEVTRFGNQRMTVCFNVGVNGWYLNVTMLQKAGIPLPSEDWDWNQQLDIMQKLTTPDKKQWGAWTLGVWDITWWPFIFSNTKGTPSFWADPQQTKVGYDTPEALQAFQWYVDLIQTHKVAPDATTAKSMGTGQTSDLFLLGLAAMKCYWLQFVGDTNIFIKDRFEWKLMPDPKSPYTGRSFNFSTFKPLAASKDGEKKGNLDPATDMILFLTGSDTTQNYMAQQNNRPTIPSKTSVVHSPAYLATPPDNMPLIARLVDEAPTKSLNQRPGKKYWPEWQATVQAQADKAFIGEATAAQAWKNIITESQKVMDNG